MRIVTGSHRGRIFEAPSGHRTHPMGDKIRTALFNTLGDIEGLTVLDPFAGSGALSFEAISRGAAYATAIDADSTAQQTIARNIKALGMQSRVQLIRAAAGPWLASADSQLRFDIVLLDPPYDDLHVTLLPQLAARVRPQGIVVLSHPPDTDDLLPTTFERLKRKQYGDAVLSFYRAAS